MSILFYTVGIVQKQKQMSSKLTQLNVTIGFNNKPYLMYHFISYFIFNTHTHIMFSNILCHSARQR